jgi:hypothetical protein
MVNASFNFAPAFPALLSVNKREFEKTNFIRNAGTLEQTQHVPTEHFI